MAIAVQILPAMPRCSVESFPSIHPSWKRNISRFQKNCFRGSARSLSLSLFTRARRNEGGGVISFHHLQCSEGGPLWGACICTNLGSLGIYLGDNRPFWRSLSVRVPRRALFCMFRMDVWMDGCVYVCEQMFVFPPPKQTCLLLRSRGWKESLVEVVRCIMYRTYVHTWLIWLVGFSWGF